MMQLYGQDCVRQIRTKYDSAYNGEMAALFPNEINPWLNTFDFAKIAGAGFAGIELNKDAGWQISGYTGGAIIMVSPFSTSMGSEYEYLQQPLLGAPKQMDIHWADGWELMWLNTGFFPNGDSVNPIHNNYIFKGPSPLANTRVPYIILYNRYQGKLRIFASLFSPFNAYDNVRMWLKHNSTNKSGIFRHLLNYDQTLDEPSKVNALSSINFTNKNNSTLWWSSDFQLGYDPCVCEHDSRIDFEFGAIKSSNINLFGRSVSQQQPITAFGSDFLTNESVQNAANPGKGGSLLFKSFDNMMNAYDAELAAYNTRLKSYNSPMNQGLRLILASAKTGVQNAGGSFVASAIGDASLRLLVDLDSASKGDTTTSKGWAEQASNAAKGQLAKGFDFLAVSHFGKNFFEAPQRPTMPTATFGEMRISGSIDDSIGVKVINFLTPGSYKYPQQLTAFDYPAYNNVVGLFALLRKPKTIIWTDTIQGPKTFLSEMTFVPTILNPANPLITQTKHTRFENWEQNHKVLVRLKESLKYKLNRALDFDNNKTKLYVSFVIEMENNITDSTCYKNFRFIDKGDNVYVRDAFPMAGNEPYKVVLESKWRDLSDIGGVLFEGEFVSSFDTELSSTIITTIPENGPSTIEETGVIACLNSFEPYFFVKKIKMKIAADMYFNQKGSNGLQNNTLQSFTYLLFDEDAGINLVDTTSNMSKLTLVKQPTLVLTNETIQTTDPFVYKTESGVIYVNAEQIELNGTIDVQAGYRAELHATKSIRSVSGNVNISNKIRQRIVPSFSIFGKNLETTQAELDAFCSNQSNGYKALIAANKMGEDTEPELPTEKKPEVKIYPNPAANYFNVQVSLDEEKEYNFVVYDLMGRSLIDETVRGANQPQFEITTEKLSAGTYFLSIKTTDGFLSATHRIVIIK
ncbi:T9SS type A sorting domain-containing protein [Oscillatoria amoena NRMC-F 0135]|nr:T9SS type A sorting domain-containing protein [Oscillatoria amoena NRMC-F 0135]